MELPASEIEFWRTYYSVFPFPEERADARAAMIAQTISNMKGRFLKDNQLLSLDDFLPKYSLTDEQMEAQFVQKQIQREMRMGQKFAENQKKATLQ